MKKSKKAHKKLRDAIFTADLTQEQMARAIGLSLSTFNQKINGKREFTLSECNMIAQKLNTTLDEIFLIQ